MSNGQKIFPSGVNYLAFEGGGGRGIVYQGVVAALQQIFDQTYDPNDTQAAEIRNAQEGRWLRQIEIVGAGRLLYPSLKLDRRQIKGVAGTSAGAITAFCLAIGMSARDLKAESDKVEKLKLGAQRGLGGFDMASAVFGKGILQIGSVYETFFEEPRNGDFCRVEPEGREGHHLEKAPLLTALITAAITAPPGINDVLSALPKYLTDKESTASLRITGTENDLDHPIRFVKYLHSILFDRGLMPGFVARKYFSDLLTDYLLKKQRLTYGNRPSMQVVLAKEAKDITFHDLFNLTGVDLVITCTNISAHQNKYFSVGHSPNFPVVDAVLASMSLPFFFKPLLVNTNVEFDEEEGDDDYTRGYRGLYVDGGMTRNYPLHAFDNCKPFKQRASNAGGLIPLLFKGEVVPSGLDIVAVRRGLYDPIPEFSRATVGFRLGDAKPYK
ncbi:MAG: patatin-like phospholipase family protein [Flavobacteriales bacterium]|nr:patatin-like phospholipase family protein [Flavobacteriales bacterium]